MSCRTKIPENCSRIRSGTCLARDIVTIWQADNPDSRIGYCPSLVLLANNRLVGTFLIYEGNPQAKQTWTVKVVVSDDAGRSWRHRKDMYMVDACPFVVGSSAYIIGGRDDLKIARSDDQGETWTDPIPLQTGRQWYSFPGSMVRANGRIYLVRECRTEPVSGGFPVWILAPVVLSAPLGADLTRPDAWTYSNTFGFRQVLEEYGDPRLLGVPFYSPGYNHGSGFSRAMRKIGWGEANLVQIHDPHHLWHDPRGRTFHILMRANTGRSNLACIARAVEDADGKITVDLERAPSGEPVLYLPFPGGNIGFIVLYDEETSLHWLVSNQITDSMKRPESLHPKWYGLAENERRRLALYFSRNCVDWCFAGLIAAADNVEASYYHGGSIIVGDDLLIMMRVADSNALNLHNSNAIKFCRVRDFRALAY